MAGSASTPPAITPLTTSWSAISNACTPARTQSPPPHPEAPTEGRPRRTHDGRACFEGRLRRPPQHEGEVKHESQRLLGHPEGLDLALADHVDLEMRGADVAVRLELAG